MQPHSPKTRLPSSEIHPHKNGNPTGIESLTDCRYFIFYMSDTHYSVKCAETAEERQECKE